MGIATCSRDGARGCTQVPEHRVRVWKALESRRPSGRGPQESNLGPAAWPLPPLGPCLPVWFAGAPRPGSSLQKPTGEPSRQDVQTGLAARGADSGLTAHAPGGPGHSPAVGRSRYFGGHGVERRRETPEVAGRHCGDTGREGAGGGGQGVQMEKQDLPKPGSHSKASRVPLMHPLPPRK